MRIPTQKEIFAALARWIVEKKIDNLKEDCYPLYKKACERLAIKDVGKDAYYRYLRQGKKLEKTNEVTPVAWDQIIALIESVQCFTVEGRADLDRFVDYCQAVQMDDVAKLTTDDHNEIRALVGSKNLGKVRRLDPSSLKSNRTRIDILSWDPEMRTPWRQHEGHEFVHVLHGEVRCKFAETEDGEPTEYVVRQNEAIAFPSKLFHEFWNPTDKKIELAVARPTWCLPDQIID